MRLHGHDAIEFAFATNQTLSKYNDPTEDAREGLSVEEAEEVADEDPNLIYIDMGEE